MSKAARPPRRPLRLLAAAITSVISECSYAQRRMMELSTAPDRYLPDPDAPPETYAEFLYRTSGLLQRERSAAARAGRH